MKNPVKTLKPKANSLLDFSMFLRTTDVTKNQTIGNALSELMEKETFPPPIQKFLTLPKFQELVELLKEGTLDTESLAPKEIHSIQLLLESFHKLVHLNYDYEEIEDSVVQAKVLEQNIQDYLLCIDFIYPYEGKLINEILSDLFESVHLFIERLTTTIRKSPEYFTTELFSLMDSPVISLLSQLDRPSYKDFLMEQWYPVAIELNIEGKLEAKKKELALLAKGNAHKILNQMQTMLSDMSRIYLKYLPADIAKSIKAAIKIEGDTLSGQKVNELFYLEFWKEPYEVLLVKEKGVIAKLLSLSHQLWPLKESLYSLINDYGSVLPESFSSYVTEITPSSERMISILGKPNLLAGQLSIGFYNTQYEYLNELLSTGEAAKIPPLCKSKIDLLLPTLISFLETYYLAKPFPSVHVMKDVLENLFSGPEAFEQYSVPDIEARIEQIFTLLIPTENPPIPLLAAGLNKLIQELHLLLNEVDSTTVEHRVLQEKIISLEKIDLPSYAETWYTLGELLGVIFIYMSYVEDCFLDTIETRIKNLFSHPFFRTLFQR